MLITQEELAARVAEQQAAVMAAGLLDKKESEDSAVIGPSMPEHEPPHTEVHWKPAVCFLLLKWNYVTSNQVGFLSKK